MCAWVVDKGSTAEQCHLPRLVCSSSHNTLKSRHDDTNDIWRMTLTLTHPIGTISYDNRTRTDTGNVTMRRNDALEYPAEICGLRPILPTTTMCVVRLSVCGKLKSRT